MDDKFTRERQSMSAVDMARDWARALEDREVERSGGPLRRVRPVVARRSGVPESKLLSLRKNRLKDITVGVYDKLRGAVIRELEAELAHVEHELQILRQIGVDPAVGEMHSALASREKIRIALGLDASNEGGK